MIQVNFKKWNQITVGDCFQSVNQQRFQVLVPCSAMEYVWTTRKRLVSNFLRLIRPEINLKEFTLAKHKENEDQFHKLQGQILFFFSQDDKQKWRHNSNVDICRKAVDNEFVNTGGISANFYDWTAKIANIGAAIRQNSLIHNHSWLGKYDSKIK